MPSFLIVERDGTCAERVRQALSAEGWPVRVLAETGAALEAASAEAPDLVFVNSGLPGAGDLLAGLREAGGTSRSVALVDEAQPPELGAQDLGADEVLRKPFEEDQLWTVVRGLLGAAGPAAMVYDPNEPKLTSADLFGDLLEEVVGADGEEAGSSAERAAERSAQADAGTATDEAESAGAAPGTRRRTPTGPVPTPIDDIDRKLEETLSGVLDLKPRRKAPAAAEAPISEKPDAPAGAAEKAPSRDDPFNLEQLASSARGTRTAKPDRTGDVDDLLSKTLSGLKLGGRARPAAKPREAEPAESQAEAVRAAAEIEAAEPEAQAPPAAAESETKAPGPAAVESEAAPEPVATPEPVAEAPEPAEPEVAASAEGSQAPPLAAEEVPPLPELDDLSDLDVPAFELEEEAAAPELIEEEQPEPVATAAPAEAAEPTDPVESAEPVVGSKAVGSEAVGSEAVGSKAVGSKAVGSEAVGSEAVGSRAVGSEAVGSKAAQEPESPSPPTPPPAGLGHPMATPSGVAAASGGEVYSTQLLRVPKQEAPKAVRPEPGQQFGHYTLIERIAVGGMAEVWKARMEGVAGFQKTVAIKKILPHLTENQEFEHMFVDEAKVVAELNHPNIIHVYDLGKIQNDYYIAMEYVEGKDLRSILNLAQRKHLPVPKDLAVLVAIGLASGLDYAHRKHDAADRPLRLVHRDVSPQNVLISYEGDIKLCDFGIAKVVSKASQTQIGALKGKLQYMSPEQAWGRSVDARSDIFALGSLLFELLTGERLFAGNNEISVLEAVRECQVRGPREVDEGVSEALDAAVRKALAKEPESRYGSAGEMRERLERLLGEAATRPNGTDLATYLKKLIEAPEQPPAEVDEVASSTAVAVVDDTEAPAPAPGAEAAPAPGIEAALAAGAEPSSRAPEDDLEGTRGVPIGEPTVRMRTADLGFDLARPGEGKAGEGKAGEGKAGEETFVEAVPPKGRVDEAEPGRGRWLWIAALVVVVVLGALAYFYFSGRGESNGLPAPGPGTGRGSAAAPGAVIPAEPAVGEEGAEPADGEAAEEGEALEPALEAIKQEAAAEIARREEEARQKFEEQERQLQERLRALEEANKGEPEPAEPPAKAPPKPQGEAPAAETRGQTQAEPPPAATAAQKPAAQAPAGESPEAATPAGQTAAGQTQPAQSPGARSPEAQSPEAQSPEAGSQEVPATERTAAPPPPPPRPAVKVGELVTMGPGVQPPTLVSINKPKYPPMARRAKAEGVVVLSLLVDENGRVAEIRVVQGAKSKLGLNEAALSAAESAKFEPAVKEGVRVKMWTTLKIPFQL